MVLKTQDKLIKIILLIYFKTFDRFPHWVMKSVAKGFSYSCTYNPFILRFFSQVGYFRVLSRVPHAVQ